MWSTAIRAEARAIFFGSRKCPSTCALAKRSMSTGGESGFMFDDEVLGISKRFKVSALDASALLSLEKPRVLITGALGQLGQGLARILR